MLIQLRTPTEPSWPAVHWLVISPLYSLVDDDAGVCGRVDSGVQHGLHLGVALADDGREAELPLHAAPEHRAEHGHGLGVDALQPAQHARQLARVVLGLKAQRS